MTRPSWARLGVGCLILAALAGLACDRKTPSGPDGIALAIPTGAVPTLDVTLAQAPITLTEGGDICIRVTPVTIIIVKNTRLMCDMECQTTITPCIQFGASGIKLDLNRFTMRGPADPPNNCEMTSTFNPGDGIANFAHSDVVIEGPGLVERFRRHGIALLGVTKAKVIGVTAHHNCFSGVWLNGVTESLVERVVSVRNAVASSLFPCGGICVTNSNNNVVRRSEVAGNGSVAPGTPAGTPNDFGIGLVGTSRGNLIEENGIGGNVNGILLFPATRDNIIRKNVIAGNPPVQLGSGIGADIRNFSPAGANRFEDNLCVRSDPPGNPPCPNLPQFSGHQNS